MPKFFCDYCDVYLTHDSMSVRKAHNSGRNHIRNVVDYYQQLSQERAQSVIDAVTNSYAAEGQANPMNQLSQPGGFGRPGMPPFPFPPGPNGMPFPMPGGPAGRGGGPGPLPPNFPPNMPFPPPNMPGFPALPNGAMPPLPFPFPGAAGGAAAPSGGPPMPSAGMPFPMPGFPSAPGGVPTPPNAVPGFGPPGGRGPPGA